MLNDRCLTLIFKSKFLLQSISIKSGLWTRCIDCGLRNGDYGLGIKHGLSCEMRTRTTDWGQNTC